MTRAEFITKSGMKIILEGTSQELAETIEEFERKERRDEERKIFYEKMIKEREKMANSNVQAIRNMTVHHRISLTDILANFIKEGFFNEPRKIGEVMERLQKAELFTPTSTVHPILGRLVLKNKLARKQNENGVWQYFKVKEEKR